ncbi:amidohydrolase family protein [Vitreoscilla massiliensis]|uniref:Amidohydrolase family protein n=1 Tax=Vitreoscilla massiliensis TaxID=1689272 RepID=A0ABY4E6S2_9NEIS|nr:amidohydrolase family protein [Vitreoscilla massiliensis]UOO90078.1 amidohydrolase family protein [Vitreoscilla massiliensis]
MIDSHIHFWRYQAAEFPWIDEGMAVLKQDFLPEHLLAASNGQVEAMVAVQARTSWAENQYLVDLAATEPRLQAVVGWFDFDGEVTAQLKRAQDLPLIKGFRHLIQDEADPSAYLLTHSGLNQAVPRLQAASLVYEVLVQQADLAAALAFCQRHDNHYLIVDHMAKPVFGDAAAFAHWHHHMQALAALPHVLVKVSGLETEAGVGATAADLQRHVDSVYQMFGAERLLWGSNWPVAQLTHSYSDLLQHAHTLTQTWSASERAALFSDTARRVYQLNTLSNTDNTQRTHNGFALAR